MTIKIAVKHLSAKLFGELDVPSPEAWRVKFSSTSPAVPIEIDEDALEMISEDLGLDSDGLLSAAHRYVSGVFRPKAEGMAGTQLGDLGEVLAYLRMKEIGAPTRVISYRRGNGQGAKQDDKQGEKFEFPQPDFLLKDANGNLFAVEVKSTQAFEFLNLERVQRWTHLQPCNRVSECRTEALRQLGFVDGTLQSQKHKLVLKSEQVVPFPASQGKAMAVLVQDGRVSKLRSDKRFQTPPECREADPKRNCWNCVKTTDHAIVVTLSNNPGQISLAGGLNDNDPRWIGAYSRWTQALRMHEEMAIRSTSSRLVDETRSWLETRTESTKDELKKLTNAELQDYWAAYIDGVVQEYSSIRNTGQGLSRQQRPNEGESSLWRAKQSHIGEVRDALQRSLRFSDSPPSNTWYCLSIDETAGDDTKTAAISFDDGKFAVRLLSKEWWSSESVESAEQAAAIAEHVARLIFNILDIENFVLDEDSMEARQVNVTVNDTKVLLGWKAGFKRKWRWRQRRYFLSRFHHHFVPLCCLGDATIRVFKDGRATFQMPTPSILQLY